VPIGNAGFIQLRRGISEHVRDGRLSFFEASLYVFVMMEANPATGLCYGSAGLFAAIYGISPRTCRDALEKLEQKGYLRRFPTRGKHGSYPILINKFLCSVGAMKGMYVNSLKSEGYSKIYYERRDDGVNDGAAAGVNESVNESAGSKILDTREEKLETKKQKPTAKVKPLPDERFGDFRNDFETAYKFINKIPAPWDATEATRLSRWLKKNPTITREQWQSILKNRKASAGVNHKAELSQWLKYALSWLDGQADKWGNPINQSGGNNATVPNGTGNQLVGVLERTLNRRQRQRVADQDGDLPAGVEVGRDDAGSIHGVSGPLRLTSVSSGDAELSDKGT
jgi:hypothetical protein